MGLDVSYVAEHHENLHHILVFLTVSGAVPNATLEAEVVARDNADELPRLVVRCGTSSSSQLELPAHVVIGKKEVRLVGETHYEIKLHAPSSSRSQSRPCSPPSTEIESTSIMDATYFSTTQPTSFICTSCSLPLVHASQVSSYRDLPSEHWAELVDAWMCHSDMKLHEHVKKNSKDGFWPEAQEALVGGSYVLVQEEVVLRGNIREPRKDVKVRFSPSPSPYSVSLVFQKKRTYKKAGIGLLTHGRRAPQLKLLWSHSRRSLQLVLRDVTLWRRLVQETMTGYAFGRYKPSNSNISPRLTTLMLQRFMPRGATSVETSMCSSFVISLSFLRPCFFYPYINILTFSAYIGYG